ncbi:hypothetical protein ABT354_19605 [Streptomyces sp. NPDC000594]|uniref:hypothetical protein n=1 Tax=Streptomyces sp. NPDC000594 TaxID=3154261 RepID=UPI003317E430
MSKYVSPVPVLVATRCRDAGLDAVVVPVREGRKAICSLEKDAVFEPVAAPVPFLRGSESVTLLVLAGTGTVLADLRGVRIATGAEVIPLPPTWEAVWGTPPWHPRVRQPAVLPAGSTLRPVLESALSARV